ncbi:MAG: glycosyltransferase family 4 protein [Pseudomonadota bacterium]
MSDKSIVFVSNTSEFFVSHRLPLARHLAELGWNIAIITDDGPYGEHLLAEGFDVYRTGFRRESAGIFGEVRNFLKISSIIRRLAPEFVHNVALKSAVFGSFAARWSGDAIVINAITGLGLTFVAADRPLQIRRFLVERLLRLALASSRCYSILQNRDDLELLASRGIVDPSRAAVIYGSGVDAADYAVPETRDTGSRLKVILAARLLWSKGVGEFVAAADELKEAFPQTDFVLAGKVDTASSDHIPENELRRWTERANVTWIGYVEDMRSFLREADIVVLPSYYREGVPKVLIEAAMAGRPAVTTDSPGCREAVVHERTGLLVPPRDSGALAQAIADLLRSEDYRRKLGEQARVHAMERFELQQVLKQTTDVYEVAAQKTRKRRDRPMISP